MSEPAAKPTIEDVRNRLDEIVAAVSDESVDLDEALGLYEEAVALGLAACDLNTAELVLDEEEREATAGDAKAEAEVSDADANGAAALD